MNNFELNDQIKNKLDTSNSLYVSVIPVNGTPSLEEKWEFEFDSDNRISSLKRPNHNIYNLLSEAPNGIRFTRNHSCKCCYCSCDQERIRLYPAHERVIGEIILMFNDEEYSEYVAQKYINDGGY